MLMRCFLISLLEVALLLYLEHVFVTILFLCKREWLASAEPVFGINMKASVLEHFLFVPIFVLLSCLDLSININYWAKGPAT